MTYNSLPPEFNVDPDFTHMTDAFDDYIMGMASADELFDPIYDEETPCHGPILTQGDSEFDTKVRTICQGSEFMSRDREIELADVIKQGASAERFLGSDVTANELKQIVKTFAAGKAAQHELVLANLKFPAWYVRESMGFNKKNNQQANKKQPMFRYGSRRISSLAHSQLEYADRLQIAHEAMLLAAAKYTSADSRFLARASVKIEAALQRGAEDTSTLLKVPVHVHAQINSVKTTAGRYSNGPDLPTNTQLIFESHIQQDFETLVATHARMQPISYEVIQAFFATKQDAKEQSQLDWVDPSEALDAVTHPQDYSSDENEPEFQKNILNDIDVISALKIGLADLDGRLADILVYYFGLTGDDPMTLEEIGEEFGLSRERIRQLEYRALNLISGSLNDFMRKYRQQQDVSCVDDTCLFTGLRSDIPITEDELLSIGVEPIVGYVKNAKPKSVLHLIQPKKYEDDF